MNGNKKFHKANGPAFSIGEEWVSGTTQCKIIAVRKFGEGKWDYEVTYQYDNGVTHSKDAWCFQVRYEHVADEFITNRKK